MRPLVLVVLLLAPALAGCAVPSGVNADTYPGRGPAPHPTDADMGSAEARAFYAAMRDAAVPRPDLADESAYDRFLENATRWAKEGIADADAARPLDEDHPDARQALDSLTLLRSSSRGSDKEVLATGPARAALAVRWGVSQGTVTPEDAAALVARALEGAAAANASVHDARLVLSAPSRNAMMRAEAVLGLAISQAHAAESAARSEGRAVDSAASALDAIVSAAGVRFWLAEAEAAHDPAAAPFLAANESLLVEETTAAMRAAEEAMERVTNNTSAAVHGAVVDIAFGIGFVNTLTQAGLPEGAWASAQGLRENVLVLELALEDEVPTPDDVVAAWEEAAANVRTFRDAQRYDRALAGVEAAPSFGGADAFRIDYLRAFGAIALMREISEERERVLAGDA